MHITIRLFANLRDRAGLSEIGLDLPEKSTIAHAIEQLRLRLPTLADHLNHIAFALNRSYTQSNTPLQDGDELALIPPVSGG
jgi:molybdopterin synthase sulfur carrier subunit